MNESMPIGDALRAGLISQAQYDQALEAVRAHEALEAWHAAQQEEYARDLLKFASVVCGCPPGFTWNDGTPAQARCPLHSQMPSMLGVLGLEAP